MRERRHVLPLWLLLVYFLAIVPIGLAQENDAIGGGGLLAFDVSSQDGVDSGVFTINVDGTNLQRLTEEGVSSNNPVWSPDGSQIAFNTYDVGYAQINIMDADGSNSHVLTSGNSNHFVASWFPDGSQLLYSTSIFGLSAGTLNAINSDGTGERQILDDPEGENDYYSLSPDGTRIAYIYGLVTTSLYIMDADGTNAQQLTPDSPPGLQSPAWSPDSTKLAFSDSHDIYVINADGTDERQLRTVDDYTYSYSPTWSPDGSRIALASDGGIYVMRADGSDQQLIISSDELGGFPDNLTWQPNLDVEVVTVSEPSATSTPVVSTSSATSTPVEVSLTEAATGEQIAYGDTVDGKLELDQSIDYIFEGESGSIIRLELVGEGVCYRFTAPEDYPFDASVDGDLYYGLWLPLDGTYTLTLVGVSDTTNDYSLTVVHDLAYEYGVQGILGIGGMAEVYTEDEGLKLRAGPSTEVAILETMPSGTVVEIIDGPYDNEGYTWWNVRAPSGNEGWSVESANDIQTLNPVAYPIIPPDIFPPTPCE